MEYILISRSWAFIMFAWPTQGTIFEPKASETYGGNFSTSWEFAKEIHSNFQN